MIPSISIILGTYNRFEYLRLTIDNIRKETKEISSEIIVIDGGSTDGTIDWITRQKDIILILQHNHGEWNGKPIERKSWGYFMNLGFKCASGKYICMLSDDCLMTPNSITNGYNLFEKKLGEGERIGAVAFYWREWPTNEDYWAGLTLGDNMYVNHGLYLKAAVEEVDYIDEDTYRFYSADGDLCLKMIQKGYKCIACEDSYVEHYSHANMDIRSENEKSKVEDWKNYLSKWENIFYFKEAKNYGGWIRKSYFDESNTVEKFYPFQERIQEKKKLKETFIKNKINAIYNKQRIVVYGAGVHTEKLFEVTELGTKNILYLIDSKKAGQMLNNIQICDFNTLFIEKPDIIIISSFSYQDEIYDELIKKVRYDCKIIRLYDQYDVEPFYV